MIQTRLLFKLRSGTHGLMRNWVDIEVEMVSVCVVCEVRTVKVWITFCGIAQLIQCCALFLEHLKKTLGKEFEHFKSCDTAGKSCFILGTELWGSHYEELLYIVKSYIIDIIMGSAQIKVV